jgi:hypothetical protein
MRHVSMSWALAAFVTAGCLTTDPASSRGPGGEADIGGSAGTDGAAGTTGTGAINGAAGTATGAAGTTGVAGTGAPETGPFSFFVTSQAGLAKLANNPLGFGGDLRFGKADGLSGADEICRRLAEKSMPGNAKTWRAFLSATKGLGGLPVNAADRIGEGPWFDRLGRIVALTRAALLQDRPMGADPVILQDLPNEDGVPNHNPGAGLVDNHDVLTGSTTQGKLDAQGLMATCQDWTSSASNGGKPRCGVSWPRASLTSWISTLEEGGCAPGATPPGADSGAQGTVGALGGYGGFYCMALQP